MRKEKDTLAENIVVGFSFLTIIIWLMYGIYILSKWFISIFNIEHLLLALIGISLCLGFILLCEETGSFINKSLRDIREDNIHNNG